MGSIVDANVHLWDQGSDPVFWLTDRTLVRDLIGDYDSLPDVYTLDDYRQETEELDVRGIVWSDAGAADPVAAAEWVSALDDGRGFVVGLVSLGDPADEAFVELVARLSAVPLVSSVRVRFAAGLASVHGGLLERPGVMEGFGLLAEHDLVATIEATSEQLSVVGRLADELPSLRIVVD